MYRCRPWPAATGLIRACSGGGGGLSDHACQQRCSAIQGESQARAARGPALSAAMFWPRWRRILLRRGIGEPGGPAEGEGAVDQGLVAADREVGADLEIGPAQLVFDLLVALLYPVADRVQAHDLGQAGGRVRAAGLARAAGPGQVSN